MFGMDQYSNIYVKQVDFFSNLSNLALMMSTDGVPLFKSSSISLWPVYLVILNLPREIRINSENILLCGLWVGSIKPIMNDLLNPIAKTLKELSITISLGSTERRILAKLVLGVFDLPAKASVLCCKQYNGEYGCSVCYKGYLTMLECICQMEHIWKDHMVEDGLEAEATNSCIRGVKGLSPLTSLFNIVDCVPVDYMHAVLEGVTKKLLKGRVP